MRPTPKRSSRAPHIASYCAPVLSLSHLGWGSDIFVSPIPSSQHSLSIRSLPSYPFASLLFVSPHSAIHARQPSHSDALHHPRPHFRSPLHVTLPIVPTSMYQPLRPHPHLRPPLTSTLRDCLSRPRSYRFSFFRHFWYSYYTNLGFDPPLISALVFHCSPCLCLTSHTSAY
jgi:hypothetical protein